MGTTGEFLTVSADERRMFVDQTVKYSDGKIHVLVGSMDAYTPNAVRFGREEEELAPMV